MSLDAPEVGKARGSQSGALFVSYIDDAATYSRQNGRYTPLFQFVLPLIGSSHMPYYVDVGFIAVSGTSTIADVTGNLVCTVRVLIIVQILSFVDVLNSPGTLGHSRYSYRIKFDRRRRGFTLVPTRPLHRSTSSRSCLPSLLAYRRSSLRTSSVYSCYVMKSVLGVPTSSVPTSASSVALPSFVDTGRNSAKIAFSTLSSYAHTATTNNFWRFSNVLLAVYTNTSRTSVSLSRTVQKLHGFIDSAKSAGHIA